MNEQLAERLSENGDFDIYSNYSGRGMYGKTTTGIVCDNPMDLLEVVLNDPQEFCDDGEPLFDGGSLRMDNMGLQTIVY